MVRAKFKLTSILRTAGSEGQNFTFTPVSDDGIPENERFSKWTPSGSLNLYVTNPEVIKQWELGNSYYLDFTEAK